MRRCRCWQRGSTCRGRDFSGEALKAAITKSGVFLENGAVTGSSEAAAKGDLKAGLLHLRGTLSAWLGEEMATVSRIRRLPPPIRGVMPRAREAAEAPLPLDGMLIKDAGRTLHGHADAALSRMKLLQLASLPDQQIRGAGGAEWRMELPLMLGQELAMAQFVILRDAPHKDRKRERGWQMRFAVHFAVTGEVGANVGLNGRQVSVMFWAAEAETAGVLRDMLPELAERLRTIGLDPGSILCRDGAPDEAPKASRHLVDTLR